MVVRNAREDDGRAFLQMLDELKQGAKCPGVTIQVLSAVDHDGVCATKMMMTVLNRLQLKNNVVPVTNNSDIIEHIRQIDEFSEVRSLLFLNCGGGLNLQQLMEEHQVPDRIRCFVVDSHRPLLLSNLSARSQRVCVLDDDHSMETERSRPPVDETASEASEGESDAEKENEWNPDVPPEVEAARKRRRRQDREDHAERKRMRINEYYGGVYHATPAAMSLFKLARQANCASQDMLWLAAVSLTGYYDLGLFSEMDYNRLAYEELKDFVDRAGDTFFSDTSQDASGNLDGEEVFRPRHREREKDLRLERDLRLPLYKHWNLEESILHSAYFYGTLELHKDKGKRRLKSFFAECGIIKEHYTQNYQGMHLDIRRSLPNTFSEHGKKFDLVDSRMFMEQFLRNVGIKDNKGDWLRDVSSTDAMLMVTALLSSDSSLESIPSTTDGKKDLQALYKLERERMVKNFWQAVDTSLCKEVEMLRAGVSQAMLLIQEVLKTARFLQNTKGFNQTRRFVWCKLDQPHPLLRHPLALRRLAVWLTQVSFSFRPQGSQQREKPMLLIIRDRVRSTYLCVGSTPLNLTGDKDVFSSIYRKICTYDAQGASRIRFRYDFFNRSCIEVACEDFDRFWKLMLQFSV